MNLYYKYNSFRSLREIEISNYLFSELQALTIHLLFGVVCLGLVMDVNILCKLYMYCFQSEPFYYVCKHSFPRRYVYYKFNNEMTRKVLPFLFSKSTLVIYTKCFFIVIKIFWD